MIIGVTGGVGTGKSTVLSILKNKFNAAIIMADDVAKDLMKPGRASYNAVCDYFGDSILSAGSGSEIDRLKLSKIVFNDKEKLLALNSLTHPLVEVEIKKLLKEYNENNYRYIILESAILIEAGYIKLLDELWYVKADYDVRIRRLSLNRGYTKEKSDNIMKNQKSDQEFMDYADFIIDNSGEIADTEKQITEHLSNERNNNN